jgi:hypothetical protein
MAAQNTTASSTIRPLPAPDQTRTPQIVDRDLFELRAQTAEIRDEAARLHERAGQLHTSVQAADLDRRAAALAQNNPADLLETLGEDLGMPWSLVAELIGVSPTAIRKWRKGGALTPDSRIRLARLVAFCQVIAELEPRITDPALWLQTQLAAATSLTAKDLYAAGHADQLLDLAAQRASRTEVLDAFSANWRSIYPADDHHRVVIAPDGVPSIIPID